MNLGNLTGAELNAMTMEQRIELLRGPFGKRMHDWIASHVTFFWWVRETKLRVTRRPAGITLRNGSVFFVDIGGKLMAVTAAHVYRGFLASKESAKAKRAASDRQITCPFEREYWIDSIGHGLPPQGFDLGGISGGPLLLPMEKGGEWTFHLGGVISEAQASKDFETVIATPAHFITEDGRIREQSLPVRHAVRAFPQDATGPA